MKAPIQAFFFFCGKCAKFDSRAFYRVIGHALVCVCITEVNGNGESCGNNNNTET
jgi:hypothetical protein